MLTEQILPHLLDDFRSGGLTLCHDADSAYLSKATEAWVKKDGLKVLPLPGVSPDFSIFKSMANPLKQAFHPRRSVSEDAALRRFKKIFMWDMN